MSNIQGIGLSGLDAATRRLEVSADNVANALTPGYTPARVDSSAAAVGGVATRVVRPAPDPAAAGQIAGVRGGAVGDGEVRADRALLAASGTDLAAETVDQLQAAAFYRANLATIETGDALTDALLKMVR